LGENLRATTQRWSNESVLKFAGDHEPIKAMVLAARELVLEAMDKGWSGPPFDPLKLARIRGIQVSPRADIPDARTVPMGQNRFVIEFNPTRPPGRLRYSIAHEIAHTLFPDCGERVRNRVKTHLGKGDEWQLEALCNIAAAEILMPVGSMKKEQTEILDIDQIAKSRKQFDVSMEAVLIRFAHLSDEACAVFVASRKDNTPGSGRYSFDYVIPSRRWKYDIPRGTLLPESSPLAECTAVGFTAKGDAAFLDVAERLRVECIGIPPYPGALFPRVAGFMSSRKRATLTHEIKFVIGDVLRTRGTGRKLIAHVVSDATPNWGGSGVAKAIKRKWPAAQERFRNWFGQRRRLGEVHFCEVEDGIEIATMICQRGYGPSDLPRIRYAALEMGLQSVSAHAHNSSANVHMPRIGCGQGGGSWILVEELINSSLVAANLPVTIYDFPNSSVSSNVAQLSLNAAS
jgi:O-acetyl-ADP-ribose deacetylase (regulator of RNase III)